MAGGAQRGDVVAGTSCISSTNSAMPTPRSAATARRRRTARSGRSPCRRSRPGPVPRARRCPGAGEVALRRLWVPGREGLEHAEEVLDPVGRTVAGGSRGPPCAARPRPGGGWTARDGPRASRCPKPCRAIERKVSSMTVLPTPRSPVSTMLRSGRPRATRSSTTSNCCVPGPGRPARGGAARRRGRRDCVPGPRPRALLPHLARSLD